MNTQPNATHKTQLPHRSRQAWVRVRTSSSTFLRCSTPRHDRCGKPTFRHTFAKRSNTARSAFTPTFSALRRCPPAATCEKASQKCCMRPYGRHILPYVLYPTYSPTYSLTYYTLRAPIRTIAYVLPYVLTLRAPLRTPSRTIAIYRTGKSFKSTIRNSRMPACTRTPTNLIPAPDIAQYAASPKPPAVYVSRPHSHIYLAP